MDIADIVSTLNIKLAKQLIPARILLDKFRIIEESSRKTSSYSDPKYAPFYYYLGCLIQPVAMVEIGFKLGLLGGCFLKGCKTVKHYFGFQERQETFYSPRLGKANIRSCFKGMFDFYYGQLSDATLKEKLSLRGWDLVIINEDKGYDYCRECLDLVWDKVNLDGFIVVENAISPPQGKKAFLDFCKIKNREPNVLKTRYGTGIVQK